MNGFRKTVGVMNKIADVLEGIANFICVVCLTVQVITIVVLVVGRYWFHKVPVGTEELALLCMVWMALLSICLNVRKDEHLKMEVVDLFCPASSIKYFQIICAVLTFVFSCFMIKHGYAIWTLKFGTVMSSLPISGAWFYAAIPLAGVLTAFVSVVFFLSLILKFVDEKLEKTDKAAEV